MAEKQTQKVAKCPGCSKESPQGLLYCPFCGIKSALAAAQAPRVRSNCPFCYCQDEFNADFCIICGGQINQADASTRLKALPNSTGFNWSVAAAQGSRLVKSARSPVSLAEPNKAMLTPIFFYCLPGLLLGVLAAAALNWFCPALLERLVARLSCPGGGLAVYVQPQENRASIVRHRSDAPATVTLERMEETPGAANKADLATDNQGLLTLVPPAGTYRLRASLEGHESAIVAPITVRSDYLTLVGFGTPPLVLPPLAKPAPSEPQLRSEAAVQPAKP